MEWIRGHIRIGHIALVRRHSELLHDASHNILKEEKENDPVQHLYDLGQLIGSLLPVSGWGGGRCHGGGVGMGWWTGRRQEPLGSKRYRVIIESNLPLTRHRPSSDQSHHDTSMSDDSANARGNESMEDLVTRHKKEWKALEGEKRAALKNAKSMGKKAKAKIKEVEFKYEGLERDMKERQRTEVAAFNDDGTEVEIAPVSDTAEDADDPVADKHVSFSRDTHDTPSQLDTQQSSHITAELKRQKALEKKLKKKASEKQKELDREARIAEENASAGPSRRILEIDSMKCHYLAPNKLRIEDVPADGNCLYRAIGVQAIRLGLLSDKEADYVQMRQLCADILLRERNEYEPFAELDHDTAHPATTYDEYVEHVKSTSTWGGQLELRALSHGLKCPIVVFSAEGPPLTMGQEFESGSGEEDGWAKKKAVLISFHRYYYDLGEHYNSVVPLEDKSS